VDVALPNASRSKVRRGAVRTGQGDEIGQVVALALAVDGPGADRDTPTLNVQAMPRYPWPKKRRRGNSLVTSYSRLASILKRVFEFEWAIWRVGNVAECAIAKSGPRHGGAR
jgi:hypothetical protein